MFFRYLKSKKGILIFWLISILILAVSFYLYNVTYQVYVYPIFLVSGFGIIALLIGYKKEMAKHNELEKILDYEVTYIDKLPEIDSVAEEDYQHLIDALNKVIAEKDTKYYKENQDAVDYYSTWVHQIKTPIAAARLSCQNEDTAFARKQLRELNRIEAYVEMVLTYLRLGSSDSDYYFKEYNLDEIVRPAVKKFAGEFIDRKIGLNMDELNMKVVTDEKWLAFVVGQVISNALKYTNEGEISVYIEGENTLCVRDTGIGIDASDLPRIFENGYTGFNGRMDNKASGIGLFLCRQICDRLGHEIYAESKLGEGTVVKIKLK